MDITPAAIIAFIFFSAPIIIGRVANLAGRYRLAVMVILVLLLWSGSLPAVAYFLLFRGDISVSSIAVATLGAVIALVIPLVLGGRLLARLIALRYAPAVADALASVIVGSIASFLTPVLSIYLTFSFLASSSKDFLGGAQSASSLPLLVVISMMGLMILVTASSAWILMGWGSMPVLRRRKGTVVGLVCVGLAILYSIVMTLVVTQLIGLIFPESATVSEIYIFSVALLAGGALSIIMGMLTAGFMHGILMGLATLFDLITFLATVVFIIVLFGPSSFNGGTPTPGTASRLLLLILVLSVIQLRATLIGHRVISLIGMVALAIPFILFFFQFRLNTMSIAPSLLLVLLFISLNMWLGRWGVMLRQMRYGGHISVILLILTLVIAPIGFLIV